MLPTALLVDTAWTHLPATARVIFVDICTLHRHRSDRGLGNNGTIGYGCAAGAKAANVSDSTAYRMLKKLQESGLLKLRKEGAFRVEAGWGLASEWELRIYPTPGRYETGWTGDRTLKVYQWLLNSAAYKALSSTAKCILIELMRRFDGGNNRAIAFSGPDGSYAGFSVDATERAITELRRARFVVQTAPAVPYRSQPRQWRLTMYKAEGRPPTKDFMRVTSTPKKNLQPGVIGAGVSPENVSTMRVLPSPELAALPASSAKITMNVNDLSETEADFDTRTGETFGATDTRSDDKHIKNHHMVALSSDLPAPPDEMATVSPDLFGNSLPPMPTPGDRLRSRLRVVLSRRRGTQSHIAAALRVSRQKFADALSGRARFTAAEVSALQKWLDGEAFAGSWPPLPTSEEPDVA
jgi:hypothetical protein